MRQKLVYKKAFTEKGEEAFISTLIHNQILIAKELMFTLGAGNPGEVRDLTHGETNGQWNYIINHSWAQVYLLMQNLGIKCMVDLGSGMGIGLFVLRTLMRTLSHRHIDFEGIEIHPKLAEVALRLGVSTREKDIFSLKASDLKKYDCLYMYEPMSNSKTAEAAVNHIVSIMNENHTVLLVSTGNMSYYFERNPAIVVYERPADYNTIDIYRLAKKQTLRKVKGVLKQPVDRVQ